MAKTRNLSGGPGWGGDKKAKKKAIRKEKEGEQSCTQRRGETINK